MTTTKRGRAASASAATVAVDVSPPGPDDRAVSGKHLAVKKKGSVARERRNANSKEEGEEEEGGAAVAMLNVVEAREPPAPAAPLSTSLPPPAAASPSSSSSSAFWSAVDRDALAALVAPEPVDRFLSQTWEKRPAVFRATPERKVLVERGEVFTKAALGAVVAEAASSAKGEEEGKDEEPSPSTSSPSPPPPPPPVVLFGRDVCASRYRRGVRENLGGEPGTRVSTEALRRLYGGSEGDRSSPPPPPSLGATLQVHQPQRWCDASWRLVAALEARLGCLVGANSYLTPAASQGLAPHWDDVEVFVLQIEGAKAWKVWSWEGSRNGGENGKNKQHGRGAPLASSPSGDLDERSLGQPALEVVLRPGDVLYLPRGTVHAASADVAVGGGGEKGAEEEAAETENGAKKSKRAKKASATANGSSVVPSPSSSSNHLTLSSHQRWSLCDLALAAISAASAVPPSCDDEEGGGGLPRSLRPGLPPGFLSSAGFERGALAAATAASSPPSSPSLASRTAAALAKGLRDLAEALERSESSSNSSLRLLDGAADALSADFFASRLPPHPTQLAAAGRAPRSALDSVAVRGKGLFRLVACDPGAGCGGGGGGGGGRGGEEGFCGEEEGGGEEGNGCCGNGNDDGDGGGGNGSGFVRILSCVRNERSAHLVPPLPSSSSSPSSSSPSSSDEEEEEEDDDDESEKEGSSGSGGGSKEEEEEEESEESETGTDEDEEEEGEGDCSTLYPSSYAPALAQLLSATRERPLEISHVALPSVEARLGLVYSLWSEGVIAVV